MNKKAKTRSQLKREAIIDAAKRAFQDVGVQATSMDKVAELAQVSKRTVYNHFATKEALVLHLLSDLWSQSMVQIDVPYDPDRALGPQLRKLIRDEIDFVSGSEFQGLSRVATGYFLYQPDKLQEELAKFDPADTALHRWLKAAVHDGRLRITDVDFAVGQLHNLVKGSCYWPQLIGIAEEPRSDEKERLATETVAMFLSHYEADEV